MLESIFNIKPNHIRYNKPKEQVKRILNEWVETREAEVFLTKGKINGLTYPSDKMFEVYSLAISGEINPINLIDYNSHKKPTKKDIERFESSYIANKDMKIQISFYKEELNRLIKSNGIWSNSSIFYQNVDSTGHVDKYYEYDIVSKRTFEIPLGKIYSSSLKKHSMIREIILKDLEQGKTNGLEEIAKNIPELQQFINDKFMIEVYRE